MNKSASVMNCMVYLLTMKSDASYSELDGIQRSEAATLVRNYLMPAQFWNEIEKDARSAESQFPRPTWKAPAMALEASKHVAACHCNNIPFLFGCCQT